MKKILLGLAFLAAAIYLLFGKALPIPNLGIPFWPLLFILGFGFLAVHRLLHGKWMEAYVFSILTFVLLNHQFDWLAVGTGSIILAAILAGIGGSLIFSPKEGRLFIGGKPIEAFRNDSEDLGSTSATDSDTVYGSATRYINGDIVELSGDVVFASAVLYFNHANLPSGSATYSGDAVFSNVKLYLPQDWSVEFRGDRVFSTVKMDTKFSSTDKTLVIAGDLVFSSLEIIAV